MFLHVTALLRLLIVISFASDAACQNISLTCPVLFQEGVIGKVRCLINTAQLNAAGCSNTSTTVDFLFERWSGLRFPVCKALYNATCGREPFGAMACRCAKSSFGMNTNQLNFVGDQDLYAGGTLLCSINCTSSPLFASSPSCASLTFEEAGSSCGTQCIVIASCGGCGGTILGLLLYIFCKNK